MVVIRDEGVSTRRSQCHDYTKILSKVKIMPKTTESRRPIEPSLTSPFLIANIPRTEPITPKGNASTTRDTVPQMME